MRAKLAVAVIHGIASQTTKRPPISTERSFSAGLYNKLRGKLGRKVMERDVAWREIFWSDVLSARQDAYLAKIEDKTRYDHIRKFLVSGISDAASFHPGDTAAGSAYQLILSRVRETIADLNDDTSDDTPLMIIAHSFGGHVISSYIWDMQQGKFSVPTPFQRMETIAKFVTFGSNLPLFTFSCPKGDIHPIRFPGPELPKGMVEEPWWLNYYDKDDVLGFPVGLIGPRYEEMVARGELRDFDINVGGFFTSWNPLSHEKYWTDRNFFTPVAREMKRILESTTV